MRAKDILKIVEAETEYTAAREFNGEFEITILLDMFATLNDTNLSAIREPDFSDYSLAERHKVPPEPKLIKAGWNTVKAHKMRPPAPSHCDYQKSKPRKAHAVKALKPIKTIKTEPTVVAKP